MNTIPLSSTLPPSPPLSPPPSAPTPRLFLSLASTLSSISTLKPPPSSLHHNPRPFSFKTRVFNLSQSLFDDDDEPDEEEYDDPPLFPLGPSGGIGTEEKPEIPCPPGLRQYESLVVLRPDMTEDERLGLTQKYEELLVAGGGMYVEVFNRGVLLLSYDIEKKNKEGERNTYSDGIFLLFTYFTKPETMTRLQDALMEDDDVIRSRDV
ncbi:Small ribosomal subunit protein bS6c-like protein [Drosera capensis]